MFNQQLKQQTSLTLSTGLLIASLAVSFTTPVQADHYAFQAKTSSAEAKGHPPLINRGRNEWVYAVTHHNSGRSSLGADDKAVLNQLIASMQFVQPTRGMGRLGYVLAIDAVGHTDNQGSTSANQSLSVRRAKEVQKYLAQQGILADIIRPKGKGELEPVASNSTSLGRAENRRVEVTATLITVR